MKAIAVLLACLIAAPAAAQQPLGDQARTALARDLADDRRRPAPLVVIESEMESPIMFWIGVGLLAVGVVAAIGSVTFEQRSDLSAEYRNLRLGRDLAPCGTDAEETALPIAECEVNAELLWIGGALSAVGGGLMFYGGRQIQVVQPAPAAIRLTLKF